MRMISRFSLQTVFILAFVTQVFVAVGLIGWLSFHNGQQAVDELATQLRSEITAQIEQHLKNYLAIPHLVNQLNVDAIRLGQLDLNHIQSLDSYFWQQIQRFNTVSYIGIATEKGEYIGAQMRDNNSIIVELLETNSNQKLETWETNHQGQRTTKSRTVQNYEPRRRPWYQIAVQKGQPVWTDIYVYFSGWSTTISANQPFYDAQDQLLGVATADLTLLEICDFLKTLKIGQNGQTFIMERSGLLIATSTFEKPFRTGKITRKAEQFFAIESYDPLTRATAQYLRQHFGEFSRINQSQHLYFMLEDRRQFLQVMPFQDQWGLDWLIVVVLPEADFMARIHANTRATIFFLLAALMLATLIAILTARRIVRPLQHLNTVAKALAKGQWQQKIEIKRQDEVGQLADSFKIMANQLQESFNHLEEKVKERTQDIERKNIELVQLNEKLIKVNQDKNEFLSIVAHDLKNPLSAIQGAASLIEMDYDQLSKAEVVDFISMIAASSQHMFELIRNLLDVNQIESGNVKLSLMQLDLIPTLQSLINDYTQRAQVKKITLHFYHSEITYDALVDKYAIRQVFDNLLSNAIKYSPFDRSVIVQLKQTDNQIYCEIQDEGPGLSEADQQKLFGKFTRLSTQPTGDEHSTGLGLFIVKKLMEAMNGQVWCESQLGQGSKFVVLFNKTQ